KHDSGASLSVEVLNGSTVVSAIPVSLPVGDGTNAVWYSFTSPPGITIPAIANLGLRFTSTSNTKWKIDDIRVSGQQGGGITCNEPQSLQNISVDATSATVSWGAVPTATNGFQVAIRPVGGSYGGNTNLTGTQFTFTGLQQGTDYEWRVRSRCDAGANSDWVAATFSTTVPGSAELFREEHSRQGCSDGSSVIDNYTCYSAPSLSHDGTGIINGSQANGTYPGASQGRHVFLRSQGEFYRITGANGSQFSNLTLRFGVRKNQVNADGSNLRVEVTNNGGSNWTTATVPALPTGSGTNNTWYAVEIPFPIAAGNNVGVRFTADGSTRYRIDDVEVTGISSSSRTASGDGFRISGPAFSTYRLYPNPVTTTLHLRVAPTERLLRVAVYDFRGRLLRTAERAAQLDVSDLPAGTYLL
ncbi:MAG: fibronectin type III domain-containing protein, partial [Bacteroidota bacterium]